MEIKNAVAFIASIIGILLIAAPESVMAESSWPMFQHDAQHTGRSPYIGPQVLNDPNTQVQVLLKGDSDDDYFGTPVIGSDGTLYLAAKITKAGQTKEGLWAFTKEGNQKWFYPAGGISGMPALWEPSNTVYVACEGLLAIDSNDGSLKWSKIGFSASAQQNLVVSENGIVYFLAGIPEQPSDWGLYAIDDEGQVLWVCPIAGPETDLTIAKQEDIYFGHSTSLLAIDPNGAPKWEKVFEGSWSVKTPAVGDDGTIYVIGGSCYFEKIGWRPCFNAIDPDAPEEGNRIFCGSYYHTSPVISAIGFVYIPGSYMSWDTFKTRIHGIDPVANNTWNSEGYHSGEGRTSLIVDGSGTIYTLCNSRLRSFDSQLELKWSHYLESWRSGPLSLGKDGTLYIGGKKKLYAIGSVESTIPVASFTYSPSLDEFLSGQEITFTASQDETIVSYEWSFKQGTMGIGTDEGPVIYHRFTGVPNEAVDYTITLTVRDATGRVGTDEKVITVTHLEKKAEVVVDDILGTGLSRIGARASYNWVKNEGSKDIFKISRIDLWSRYFVGVYLVGIENDSGILWRKRLPATPLDKTYYPEDLYVHASDWLRVTTHGVTEKEMLGLVSIAAGIVGLPTMPPGDVPFFYGSDTLYFAPDYIDTSDFPAIDVGDTEMLSFLMGRLCSPGELGIYDSQGRVTGLVNGEVKEEIPDSAYFNGNFVFLFPGDPCCYEVVGVNSGTYDLGVISVEEANAIIFKAVNIPTSSDTTHRYTIDWTDLSQGQEGATLEVDVNGMPERIVISDNVLRACEVAVKPLGYELISQKRLSRTEFEYTFRLRVANTWKCGFKNVTLRLVRVPSDTIILDDTVGFTLVEPEQDALSDDTFTIRTDRTITGQDSEILWQVCDCTQPKKSDFNCDWNIDVADLVVFTEDWLASGDDMLPDLYPDHRVDFIDFALLAEEWLK